MAREFYDDPILLGYWFDEENGIAQHYGFFHIMDILRESETFPTANGNPLETWLQPDEQSGGGEPTYNGISFSELDGLYIARSGSKIVRPFYVRRWVNKSLSVRTQTVLKIARMYSPKWLKLWETMFYDYDPIENYNMIEKLTNDTKETAYGKKDTFTITNMQHVKSGSETTTPGVVTTETDTVYGYNSTTGVTANKRVTTPSGNESHVYNNVTDTDTGSSNNQLSGTDTETRNYTLTRKGNIGVTTSQQMIEQQRKLLMLDYFNDIVFPDIDKVLCLQVY